KDRQEPVALLGYHHQWAPGSHQLLLAGRLQDTVLVSNRQNQSLLLDRSFLPNAAIGDVIPTEFDQKYRSDLEIYTVEAQQISQQEPHTVIFGGRYQAGEFDTVNTQGNSRAA